MRMKNNVESGQLASSEAVFDFMTDHTINLKLGVENKILFTVNKV